MENYAKRLALDHKILKTSKENTFPIYKLKNDFKYITETYDILNESISKNVSIPPSGEWLLDNYYILEEQVNSLEKELTLVKYKNLPSVNGVSRIYILADEIVKYTDANIYEENIESFITAYQTKKTISIEELWVLPVMLKICIIQYIKEICKKIKTGQLQKFKVESIVERLIEQRQLNEQKFHRYKSISENYEATAFIEYLIFSIKKYGKEGKKYLEILEEELNKVGTTSSEIIKIEHYDLALRRVSMGNSITSIRNILHFNWVNIFEKINNVDKILSKDKWYDNSDFDTRNMYREEIQKIAKKTKVSEIYIATKLIEMSEKENEHIGNYIIGDKKESLLYNLDYELSFKDKLNKLIKRYKFSEYILAIYVPTIILSILLANKYFYLAIIPISEIMVFIINKIISKLNKPRLLPRLGEIPEDVNTFVIVPTLLNNKDRVRELVRYLEIYYLSNKMENIYFALLGDASETDKEEMEYDEEIIKTGIEETKKLNQKYNKEIFFFLYRKRIFNEKQGKYLGYERKRGMINEFNNFISTGEQGTFRVNTVNIKNKKIKYVITLDADTNLIMQSAKKLIGIMEHPINKPVIKNGIVVSGYGIIQPKVGISIEAATSSTFAKVFAGSGRN